MGRQWVWSSSWSFRNKEGLRVRRAQWSASVVTATRAPMPRPPVLPTLIACLGPRKSGSGKSDQTLEPRSQMRMRRRVACEPLLPLNHRTKAQVPCSPIPSPASLAPVGTASGEEPQRSWQGLQHRCAGKAGICVCWLRAGPSRMPRRSVQLLPSVRSAGALSSVPPSGKKRWLQATLVTISERAGDSC